MGLFVNKTGNPDFQLKKNHTQRAGSQKISHLFSESNHQNIDSSESHQRVIKESLESHQSVIRV